jgi:hypothetical protein
MNQDRFGGFYYLGDLAGYPAFHLVAQKIRNKIEVFR